MAFSFVCLQPNSIVYWPSTESSIKTFTCANKRKNSGSRCVLDNNITRFPDGSSQLETRCQSENHADRGLCGPQWPTVEQLQAKMRKNCCYCQKNLGQYSSLSLSRSQLSHATNISLSRIKCERYIFIKKCVRSFIEVRILCLIMFLLIFIVVYVLRYTTTELFLDSLLIHFYS